MKKIILIGDGGHGKVVADMIESNPDMSVYAILDDRYENVMHDGVCKGPINYAFRLIEQEPEVGIVIAIGSNTVRKKMAKRLGLPKHLYVRVIHPSAVLSPNVEIGVGTVVMPYAVINSHTNIGEHAILNTGCIVEHDCMVHDFAHICPGAVLTGGVQVGEGTQIGARATVIPEKKIGSWSTVGAGAAVVDHLGDEVTAVGVPAKVIKKDGVIDGKSDSIIAAAYER